MDDSLIHKLQQRDAKRRAAFEAALRRSAGGAWRFAGAATTAGAFRGQASVSVGWRANRLADLRSAASSARRLAMGVGRVIRAHVLATHFRMGRCASGAWIRRLLVASTAAVGVSVAAAAALVAKGYLHDPADLLDRIKSRMGSALFSRDHQLLGAVFPKAPQFGGIKYADFGYVPLQGEVPQKWARYVTALEQKALFADSRNICGVDVLGMGKRVLTLRGGGSGLSQQLVKGLHGPDQVRSKNPLVAAGQKFVELGEACRLHLALGGAAGVLNLYAAYAPIAQIDGVTRGVEAGAWTIFGKSPADLTDVESAVLAAAVQRNITAVSPSVFTDGCDKLLALAANQASPDEVKAAEQCRMLRRARHAVKQELSGAELKAALEEFYKLEHIGVQPVNPFQPISTKRIVNLSSRTASALAPGMLSRITEEAEALDSKPGEPITLTIGQPSHWTFVAEVNKALAGVDSSSSGREQFCVALSAGGRPRHCVGAPEGKARANIVLARVDIASGGITRLYESNRLAFDAPNSIGSIAKTVVAMAAVKYGLSADTLVCPRSARDGVRRLRRETKPEHGYAQCGPDQLIALGEAWARSDSLAAYDVARRILGDERLREALSVLGLTPDARSTNLAYDLAFGTQVATPPELLAMGQALFGVVYDVPVRSAAPRLLERTTTEPAVYVAVRAYLPYASQRRELRALLEAPVMHPRGTLHELAPVLGAGKTGTVSSALRPNANSRPYVGGKYVLAYLPTDRSVALVSVTAPVPHPLGVNWLQGLTLAPAMAPLFR